MNDKLIGSKYFDYINAAKKLKITFYTLKTYIVKFGIKPIRHKGKNYLSLKDIEKLNNRENKCFPSKKVKDITGKKVYYLTAVKYTGKMERAFNSDTLSAVWVWQCVCGKRFKMSLANIIGRKSCGCKAMEVYRKNAKRGRKKTGLYKGTMVSKIKSNNLPVTNTSGIKGVRVNKKTGKYEAYICVSGKRMHLGTFDRKKYAKEARLKAERKYFVPLIREYKRGQVR